MAIYQIYTPRGGSLWRYEIIQDSYWLSMRHQLNWYIKSVELQYA